ncbi:hypothetical protein [Pseudaminobacter soli (ex Li et al. 2025)]|uniref:Uncharacterized protein n=1 Tax=Pseudaminobacter soli (ex Li et al. 2025) TaxID=1295366 RepID=A0A2P7S9T3_9HYPH|nr:hypothetical protein [Mesorhizobium soli]PSJ59243.1 hypothetical protein C7I85_16610 [Mesorhizobium soli]
MHLSLVPKRTPFSFEADHSTPIPADALALFAEDEPGPETPHGLGDLRHRFSDLEGGGHGSFSVNLADLRPAYGGTVVALVTPHYARTKIGEVFAAWRADRSSRQPYALKISEPLVAEIGEEILVKLSPEGGE